MPETSTETDGHASDPDPVGLEEIAIRLGVSRVTVDTWRTRSKPGAVKSLPVPLPEPQWTVGGRPAWAWATIEEWARTTGRLPTPADEVPPAKPGS
jgi:hypothetical protein